MTCNFKFISPQIWWIVDVSFSHAIDRKDATQAQRKCLHLNCQATNIFYQSMKDNIFGEISMVQDMSETTSDNPPKLRSLCTKMIKHVTFPKCKVYAIKNV